MAAGAAVAAPAHPRLVPAPTAVPAAKAAAVPAAPVPSPMPPPAPSPVGWARWPATKADGPPDKTATAEMRYRRRRSNGREAAGKEWKAKVDRTCPEVRWLAHYALLGPYDFMDIYEAPDERTAHEVSLLSRESGALLAESWPAIPYDEFLGLARDVERGIKGAPRRGGTATASRRRAGSP